MTRWWPSRISNPRLSNCRWGKKSGWLLRKQMQSAIKEKFFRRRLLILLYIILGNYCLFEILISINCCPFYTPLDGGHETCRNASPDSPMRPARPRLFLSRLEREDDFHLSLQRNLFPLQELSRDETQQAIFSQICSR
jgi:hypothetical protein